MHAYITYIIIHTSYIYIYIYIYIYTFIHSICVFKYTHTYTYTKKFHSLKITGTCLNLYDQISKRPVKSCEKSVVLLSIRARALRCVPKHQNPLKQTNNPESSCCSSSWSVDIKNTSFNQTVTPKRLDALKYWIVCGLCGNREHACIIYECMIKQDCSLCYSENDLILYIHLAAHQINCEEAVYAQ